VNKKIFIKRLTGKKIFLLAVIVLFYQPVFCWGFYAHRQINRYAVFLLPPQMLGFYKKHIIFLDEHAVDPDKRRYAVAAEGPRHYIDIDHYGTYPYSALPHHWDSAAAKFTEDSLIQYGIVPWWVQIMQQRLTTAFKEKNSAKILKLSAELGHYVADAHVPLHACSNHNGQFTNQRGIHAFWESRIPELLAENEWEFFIGKANYINNTSSYIWQRVFESAAAADSVLNFEKQLTATNSVKFAFEERNGKTVKQYATSFSRQYNSIMNGMIERRMQQSIYSVASLWYTAWVNAGQPNLENLTPLNFTEEDKKAFNLLDSCWRLGKIIGRDHEQ
jgi:hypothetical protein